MCYLLLACMANASRKRKLPLHISKQFQAACFMPHSHKSTVVKVQEIKQPAKAHAEPEPHRTQPVAQCTHPQAGCTQDAQIALAEPTDT